MENLSEALKNRTKSFALNIIKLYQSLGTDGVSQVLGKQLLRCSTSVASNYRAATRARSTKEFYSKLCIVVEESDEFLFWLELIDESNIGFKGDIENLQQEANGLTAIFAKSKFTVGKSLNTR